MLVGDKIWEARFDSSLFLYRSSLLHFLMHVDWDIDNFRYCKINGELPTNYEEFTKSRLMSTFTVNEWYLLIYSIDCTLLDTFAEFSEGNC